MSRLAALLIAPCICAVAQPAAGSLDAQMKSVIDAFAIAESNAADPVAVDQAFYQGAIPGLLRTLDPHSVFFPPDQFEQLRQLQESTQKGFGTVVSILPGRVIVLQTLPGTPSEKAGLAPGDEILVINGYEIARLDIDQLPELLTAARQKTAQLFVRRAGSSTVMRYTLTPEALQESSVDRTYFLGAGIGYVRIASFDENTAKEFQAAVEKLGGHKLVGLVLDLRNNPGGLVTAAIQVASLFLEPGLEIVSVKGRNAPEQMQTVPSTATPYKCKLMILINGKSASASEIVTGAMQDHDRATVIGETSYGKGLVQSVYPLSQSTGLALTTAFYYTPSGRSIQKPLDASKFELAGAAANPDARKIYRTDKGRSVSGGGGIQPDYVVYPPGMNRLRAALEASASFTAFATEYLKANKVTAEFEVTPELVDRFRLFAAQRGIQPGPGEWSQDRNFIENRMLTEVFNQAFGVEKGDEIEARRDPVVQKALELISN